MSDLSGSERVVYVREMFTHIAARYNLINRLMTAGQDVRWRREVVMRAHIPGHGHVLDLGAGTGDLALEALRKAPECHPVAVDFTMEMMRVGRKRSEAREPSDDRIFWACADALLLPFPDDTFDAIISGFLLRNVIDLETTFSECFRTLKNGGRFVAVDTTQPADNLLSPVIRFHLYRVIPALGRLLARDQEAYTYLPESTSRFLTAEQLAVALVGTGFRDVGFRRVMFGTVAIHWGKK